MLHELKTWPTYFQAVADGDKTFEVRRDDRPFDVGDPIILKEYEPDADRYTGREVGGKITYLLRDHSWVREGYVVMAIKKLWTVGV